jgi:hypothetical protein
MEEGSDKLKRTRGRPRGTGKPDQASLTQMADLMVADPTLKPTTAAKRVVRGISASVLRRLQVKWQTMGTELLEAARARSRQATYMQDAPLENRIPAGPLGEHTFMPAVREAADSSWAKAAREAANSPWAKAMREAANSPWAKAMREAANSPWAKAVQEAANSPWAKAAREAANSPWAKAAREAADSPWAKAMQDTVRLRKL